MIKEKDLGNYKTMVSYILDDKRVGNIVVEDTPDVINIVDVIVEEEYRSSGIATKLFNYIFNKFDKREVKYMLEVRVSNIVAINLYKKLGFASIYKREKYYKGEDALIMEKTK